LDTQTPVELEGEALRPPEERLAPGRENFRRASALEAVVQNRRTVLLGDPGSGKSTFVNHLSLCLALHGLEPANHWCDRLADWPKKETNLLPVPVILRDFARTLPPKPAEADAATLWDFIARRLQRQKLEAVAKPLEKALDAGQAIVLLDGLDEIATPAHRKFVREAVAQFAGRFSKSRFVVTCRTLSYQQREWQLPEFPSFTLAPFDEKKIDQFIAAWFGDLKRLGVVKSDAAEPLARGLQTAIRRPDLWRLAPNPLLLTVMALVHTHKGRLPDARALLYEDTVDILLWRWEQLKQASESESVGLRQLLVDTGRSDVDLKRTLWRLAFEAHKSGGAKTGLADIPEFTLEKALAELHPTKSRDWAKEVIEAAKHRAGLLLERLPEVYTFPHRTFQEYLAGAHLGSQAGFAGQAAKLVESGAFWREVILLAVGKLVYLHGDMDKPLALVGELCPHQGANTELAWQQAWLAGEALTEMGLPRVQESVLGRDLLERVQGRLVKLIEQGALAPVERAAAGNVLARLGDPRLAVVPKKLADLGAMKFCYVPPGPFLSGDEGPVDKALSQGYWIGRYPVTAAQFAWFVKEGGYRHADFWPEASAAECWKDGQFKPLYENDWASGPQANGFPFDQPNHPVVGVSWYEALAFCRWLTVAWSGQLPPGFQMALPSGAEWEKAARGGRELPAQNMVRSLAAGLALPPPAAGQPNPNPKRAYPWGDQFDPNFANCDPTGIKATSAVGCFVSGASPCLVEELSGNVWEWCRDGDGNARGLRGGSWDGTTISVRCAFRLRFPPGLRRRDLGFRVVASSPFSNSGG
jgi:formylglycine-generating enzyme required for sulfatase activity